MSSEKNKLVRISISLPKKTLTQFDKMVSERKFDSRSQAITEVIHQTVNEYKQKLGSEVMAGTINLVYDHSVPNLHKKLSELQHLYLNEIISCLNVNLTHTQTLAVFLVQGPGDKLKHISNAMISQRGIVTGSLQLSAAILPPIHPLPESSALPLQANEPLFPINRSNQTAT